MVIIYGIFFLFLFLPVLGEAFVYFYNMPLSAGVVTSKLVWSNFVYALIVFILFHLVSGKKVNLMLEPFNNEIRLIERVMLIMIFVAVIVFLLVGYKFLVLGVYRGEIRVSLGSFGMIYTWLIRYLCPALLLCSTFVYLASKQKKKLFFPYIITWTLCLMIGVFTGYKAVIILSILPAISILYFQRKLLKLLLWVTPLSIAALVAMTSLVMDYKLMHAFEFLMHRMTVMTAYGTIGVWNLFSEGVPVSNSIKLVYSLFGNKIASFILGVPTTSVEFLETNLSRYITYLVYPDKEGALAGTVNVTVTNFGEAIYMLGSYFPVYAVVAGVISGLVIRKFKRSIRRKNYALAIVFLMYFFTSILPWFNSLSIVQLISLPTMVYITLTYISVHLVFRVRIF